MTEQRIDLPWGASPGPEPIESDMVRRLAALRAEHGPLVPLHTYRHDPLVVVGRDVVAHVASGPDAAAQVSREAATRVWAQGAGVSVPAWELIDSPERGGAVLVSARVRSDPGTDREYAVAAVQASRVVQSIRTPPPEGGRTWVATRRSKPLRAARALASPLRIGEARALRDAVAQVPADGWAHGDYRTYNVLYDAPQRRVHLVDWEFVGRAWRGSDLLALWAGVDAPDVADLLLESVVADRGSGQASDVGLMLLWSCVRVLAEQVTGGPIRDRDRGRIARVQARVSRARHLARDLGTVL